ncbi:MAG: hypothetical protein ACO26G_06495 [Rickettsiales bacterium]
MNNFFKGLGEFFTALGECCMPSKKEREIHPPATATNSPSATQSNYSQKNQEMMILILRNYNDVLRKPSSTAPDADLFNSETISDQIKSWNNNKNFIYSDYRNFHRIFRKKLEEHLQEIQDTSPQDYKDKKFDALLNAIEFTKNRQDLTPSSTEIKKGLANLITDAKDGKNISTSSYR